MKLTSDINMGAISNARGILDMVEREEEYLTATLIPLCVAREDLIDWNNKLEYSLAVHRGSSNTELTEFIRSSVAKISSILVSLDDAAGNLRSKRDSFGNMREICEEHWNDPPKRLPPWNQLP